MKGKLVKAFGIAQKLSRKVKVLALVAVGMLLSVQASALNIVEKGTDDAIVFTPGAIIDPVQGAVITTICAVAGLFLIVIGCAWIFKLCSGKKG